MKRTILAAIVGVAAVVATSSSYGQGRINLNNYTGSGNQILYGGGANTISGTTVGYGLVNGSFFNGAAGNITWTVGFYYALGDVTASVAVDPTGFADPSTLGGGLGFATGAPGDTTVIGHGPGGGYFSSSSDGIINGWTAGSVTFEVVAYSGVDYASSPYRGHSAAFLLTPADSTSTAPRISNFNGGMPSFSVFSVPEPSTFALAGFGAAVLLFYRRWK
jgi:hypothetical protein